MSSGLANGWHGPNGHAKGKRPWWLAENGSLSFTRQSFSTFVSALFYNQVDGLELDTLLDLAFEHKIGSIIRKLDAFLDYVRAMRTLLNRYDLKVPFFASQGRCCSARLYISGEGYLAPEGEHAEKHWEAYVTMSFTRSGKLLAITESHTELEANANRFLESDPGLPVPSGHVASWLYQCESIVQRPTWLAANGTLCFTTQTYTMFVDQLYHNRGDSALSLEAILEPSFRHKMGDVVRDAQQYLKHVKAARSLVRCRDLEIPFFVCSGLSCCARVYLTAEGFPSPEGAQVDDRTWECHTTMVFSPAGRLMSMTEHQRELEPDEVKFAEARD